MENNNSTELKTRYWNGTKNKLVRYYFYCTKGLELLNEFRYIIASIFAIYYAMKMNNIWMVPLMFLISIPILIVFGYIAVHHLRKVMEYLQIQFSTHWARYQFDLQEKQVRLLEEINEKFKSRQSNKMDK